ncbi:MAG: hypothetical protein M1825_002117 [Sarcosagium campestre]|nr:MAG: hypothetical protein M1825_002117 [Sarcosagium campestre]
MVMRNSQDVPKKDRLTLGQLATYDDIITDALIDRVYFWTQIRKNRTKYFPSRGIKEEDVAKIIQQTVIVAKDASGAEVALLQLPGLRKFVDRLKSEKEKTDFRRHLRKYINIYLPDCAFEVATTNRYTIVTQEAAIYARRVIKKGEAIDYLSGIQVTLTKEEEADLGLSRRDFSIVMSSRKKSASLFLGPARFANHDCDANSRLVTTGTNGMEVSAVREIEVGAEITVSYGDDYFGLANCECLCNTCENLGKNGWALGADENIDAALQDPLLALPTPLPDGPYSFRRKRKYGSDRGSMTPLRSSEPRATPTLKPKTLRKTKSGISQLELASESIKQQVDEDLVPDSSVDIPLLNLPPVAALDSSDSRRYSEPGGQEVLENEDDQSPPAKRAKLGERTSGSRSPSSSTPENLRGSVSTDASSILEDNITLIHPSDEKDSFRSTPESKSSKHSPTSDNGTPLRQCRNVLQSIDTPQPSLDSISRTPGDYVLTSSLLSEPYSAWVLCSTCDSPFVQSDAYFTRSACPRCERHSKLYGYLWPKTDRQGKGDKEERVLDHRTIHRFLRPEEEREIKKGKVRDLNGRASTASSIRDESEAATEDEPQSKPRRLGLRNKRSRLTM